MRAAKPAASELGDTAAERDEEIEDAGGEGEEEVDGEEDGEDESGGEDEDEDEGEEVSESDAPDDTYDNSSAVDEEEEAAYADQPAAGLSPRLVVRRAVETLQAPQPNHHTCPTPTVRRLAPLQPPCRLRRTTRTRPRTSRLSHGSTLLWASSGPSLAAAARSTSRQTTCHSARAPPRVRAAEVRPSWRARTRSRASARSRPSRTPLPPSSLVRRPPASLSTSRRFLGSTRWTCSPRR